MHATLFRHQKALELEDLHRYATEIGLDPEAFTAELGADVHLNRIRADLDGGARSGVGSTPTFFTNGLLHEGSYSGPVLLSALRATAKSG
jgi:predicted DsbA family dithiol-disulfide isomerase